MTKGDTTDPFIIAIDNSEVLGEEELIYIWTESDDPGHYFIELSDKMNNMYTCYESFDMSNRFVKNDLSNTIVDFLRMPDVELSKLIDTSLFSPTQYKKALLKMISHLRHYDIKYEAYEDITTATVPVTERKNEIVRKMEITECAMRCYVYITYMRSIHNKQKSIVNYGYSYSCDEATYLRPFDLYEEGGGVIVHNNSLTTCLIQ